MKATYCPQCDEERQTRIIHKAEKFKVRGEEVSVNSRILACTACGEEIFDEDLDEANLLAAYNKYREKHNLLPPSRIQNLREKYGLSQRALGRLLKWGEITINRYETGEIQDAAHNEVLEFIDDPYNMESLFKKNGYLLSSSTRNKLEKKLRSMIKDESPQKLLIRIGDILQSKEIDEFTGYQSFDLEKLHQMIIYVVQSLECVYKTSINKLLWYMDFLNFKEHTVSISGCNYIHLPYGPVPDNYELILSMLLHKNIEKEEVELSDEIVGERFIAKTEADLSLFTDDEIKVMDYIIDYFRDFNASQISRHSHKERAYSKTSEGEKISYEMAQHLSLAL